MDRPKIDLGLPPLPPRVTAQQQLPPVQIGLPTIQPIPKGNQQVLPPVLTPVQIGLPTIQPILPPVQQQVLPALPTIQPILPPIQQQVLPALPTIQPNLPPVQQQVLPGLPPVQQQVLPGLPPIQPIQQPIQQPVGDMVGGRYAQRGIIAEIAAPAAEPRVEIARQPQRAFAREPTTEQQRAQERYLQRTGQQGKMPQGRPQARLLNIEHEIIEGDVVTFLQYNYTTFDRGDPEIIENLTEEPDEIFPLPPYSQMIDRPKANYLFQVMEYPPEQIARIIQLTYGLFRGTKDETISLFWWGIIFKKVHTFIHRRFGISAIEQINILTTEQLNSVVPADWPYPRDRASLIFKILSGFNPPRADATKEPRYQSIIATPSLIISKLAKYVYNYLGPLNEDMEYEHFSHYSPYRHVALQQPSILEGFILNFDPNQVDAFAGRMGMIIPRNETKRVQYYYNNMKYYEKVLTRNPERIFPVPDLTDIPANLIPPLLSIYTDEELLDGYELITRFNRVKYISRPELINRITTLRVRTNNMWHFRNKRCMNADRSNIFEMSKRVNTDDDPLLSYGTLQNYRCWNRDELEGTWVERNGTFKFSVPDYRAGDPFDTFPIASVQQLRDLLVRTNALLFKDLINQINEGLIFASNANAKVKDLKRYYDSLQDSQKEVVRNYFVWMFLTSMFMRFWKGPGYRYPVVWEDPNIEVCKAGQRTVNITTQFQVRDQILSRADPNVQRWLLELPRIEYSFKDQLAHLGAEPIDFVIGKVRTGNFCLAAASDKLVQTSYYLSTQILGLNIDGFNKLVNSYLNVPQSPFNPLEVTRTGHEDPFNVLQRLE